MKIAKAVMAVAVQVGPDIYDAANREMFEKFIRKALPDGEICFLASDPSIQGKGIGTKLLDELSRRIKGKLIYLFTDNHCTYQFYEHKGFERSGEKEIKMEIGEKMLPLPCLLYS